MQQETYVDLMLRDAGGMKATAGVTFSTSFGPVTILEFKVIETVPGKPWVSVPSREYQAGGKRHFQKMVELSKPAMREVSEAILKAYNEKLGRK